MLDFSVGLPVFNRNQGNIAAARERLQQVTTDADARYIEAQALLFTTYQELQHARTETQLLNESIIPQAREVLEAFEGGTRADVFPISRYSRHGTSSSKLAPKRYALPLLITLF